ncbi:Agmatine deiminase, partial [Pseudolycoriella hygida]
MSTSTYEPYVPENGIRMIAEWERQDRVFMGWPTSVETCLNEANEHMFQDLRSDVAGMANAIIEFEPVVMLTDPEQITSAQEMLDARVTIVPFDFFDLWARDMLPVFVEKIDSDGKKTLVGVDFNFNGYGNKTECKKNAHLSSKLLEMYGIPKRPAHIISEGGALITDGRGTLFITDSCIVNENRNKQTKAEIERELKRVLGMRKIIWLEGVAGKDYTDGHVDCLVRYAAPGTVLLNCSFEGSTPDHWTRSNLAAEEVLKTATDADGTREVFVPCYTNFLIGNGFVLIPKFGDEESDLEAVRVVSSAFPGRKVISTGLSALACLGGGVHCFTKEQPEYHRGTIEEFVD